MFGTDDTKSPCFFHGEIYGNKVVPYVPEKYVNVKLMIQYKKFEG